MKKLITIAAILWAIPGYAQTPPAAGSPPPGGTTVSGSIAPALQQFDNTTNSSKLSEYRDLRDGFYLPRVTFNATNPATGLFFDLNGSNVSRDDQTILASAGSLGAWGIEASWLGVPHNYSNKAVTPYVQRAPGVFEVAATVPITFKKLATAAPDTPGVLASDDLIAAYQAGFLAPTPLSTQTNTGRVALNWNNADVLAVGLAYDTRRQDGLKSTFGPIGDRPPRTLNIQLTEPVDYRTNELAFSAEHQGSSYQVRGEYLFSDFANRIDTLRWENVYATPAPGSTYDTWDRSVSAFGARPLPPDNRYQNVSVGVGVDLPRDSRLMANAAYGRLEQNETLLPYSYNVDQLAVQTLPRTSADALMNTTSLNADYVIAPAPRLNVRAFFRSYNLQNETPSGQWQYITSDTSNLNGTSSYVNKRVSLPYAFDRQNLGAEASWRVARRSSLTLAFEHEAIGRDHREADTAENILRATWRTRAAHWLSFQARYLQGSRDGGDYDGEITHEGYWYAPAEANDNNNPALTFDNHPDMRRFDVSDRARHEIDFRVNLTPRDLVAISAYARYRKDNFGSDVTPTQPLMDTTLADAAAATPGDQLGWLEDTRARYGVDLFVQPDPRLSLNAFVNYSNGTAFERSLEFNENNKANPGAIATAELGPWTRGSSQWTADFEDRSWSTGAGATFQLVADGASLSADYSASLSTVAIAYGGYGTANFDGTPFPPAHQFAFSSPPDVREDLHVVNLRLEIPLRTVMFVAGYTYENYSLEDWQQGSAAPWVEPLGADTLLRDTSRSFQWGNRLFNLGTYLAPSYDAHIGFVGFRYRF